MHLSNTSCEARRSLTRKNTFAPAEPKLFCHPAQQGQRLMPNPAGGRGGITRALPSPCGPPQVAFKSACRFVEPQSRVLTHPAPSTKPSGNISNTFSITTGGRGGIRTHEELPLAGFQDRCLQPLGHPSIICVPSFAASRKGCARYHATYG